MALDAGAARKMSRCDNAVLKRFDRLRDLASAHPCRTQRSERQRLFIEVGGRHGKVPQPLSQRQASVLIAAIVETIPKPACAHESRFAISATLGKSTGGRVVMLNLA